MSEIESCLAAARRSLGRAQDALAREISAYPRPISGCDAQFNHLLAERARVSQALAALARNVHIATPRMP